jgi:GNAT superfamily N-acetyltransferase
MALQQTYSFREARVSDIPAMQVVRNQVKENMLSDPALVSDADCEEYISVRGMGWVCLYMNQVIGFAIADLQGNSVWALFVHPDHEGKGIGHILHNTMIRWYFSKTSQTAWLTTAPGTRAEHFYRKAGWKETGRKANGEIVFELSSNGSG